MQFSGNKTFLNGSKIKITNFVATEMNGKSTDFFCGASWLLCGMEKTVL